MKTHKYLVYRQENMRPDPILVIAETDDNIQNDKQLVIALQEGITQWAEATDDGKRLYKYAGDDMNIGDLSDVRIESFLPFCKGIHSLSFESLSIAQNWEYDTSLCNEIEKD